MLDEQKKIAVVTGATRGIGREEKLALIERGFTVYNLSRSPAADEDMTLFFACDVTDGDKIKEIIDKIAEKEGKIDLLVNNAGFGIAGPIETTTVENAKKQFDVNFFGMVNATRAVLPYMRENGGGRIINTSSVAAVFPIPFQAYYSCSKSAVNAFTLALANEVREFGISVAAIMPGDVNTSFTENRIKIDGGDYNKSEKSISVMEKDERNGLSPKVIAALVAKVACKKHIKPLYTGGAKYKCLVFLSRLLPAGFVNKVVGGMYVK